jgi:dCMP deaminase
MIIGLTGLNACGKGAVVEFLVSRGFEMFSLSDELRAEIRSRGLEVDRDRLILVGTEIRERFGPGVLAERVLGRMELHHNYVVDSIRNPAEVEALRRRKDFLLLVVEAEPERRFQRALLRNRESTPDSLERFLEQEGRELASANPSAQQLAATIRLADIRVDNNGTEVELHQRLTELLPRLMSAVERPDWDEYFMNIARVVATRSNCLKRKVAAIIVKDKRVVSTGYNGTPRGARNCNEGGCPRCNSMAPSGTALEECLCCHGEENAITQAAYHGTSLKGTTLYTTFAPCLLCTKMIINSGIVEVVYTKEYPLNDRALNLLLECGVLLRQIGT